MFSDAEISQTARSDLPKAALMRAAQACGSVRRLARALPRDPGAALRKGRRLRALSHQAVLCWFDTGRCPSERVLQVEQVTGVSRHLLRPDLYPPAAGSQAALR